MNKAEDNYIKNIVESDSHKEISNMDCLGQMAKTACHLVQLGSWFLDIETDKVVWSEETYTIYDVEKGTTPGIMLMKSMMQNSSREKFAIVMRLAIERMQPFDLEFEIVTLKGKHKWIRTIGSPVVEDGRVVRIDGAVQDVTKTEEKVNQAEQQENVMELFFDAIPDLYFVIDFDRTITDYRAKKSATFYVPPEMFLYKKLDEVMPPDVVKLFPSDLETTFEKDETIQFEYDLFSAKGYERFECRLMKLPNRHRCLAVIRDITEQHQSKLAILDSENRYRSLLEKAPFPIFLTKVNNSRLFYANHRARQQFGFHGDEEIDLPVTNFYYSLHDREMLLQRVRKEEFVSDQELLLRDRTGKPFWALVSASTVDFENEPAILVAINDIHRRREVEEELRVSEEKYRLLAEYTSDVIWVLNYTKGRFTYVSPSVEHLTGFTVDEMLNKSLENTLTPNSLESAHLAIIEALESFAKDSGQNNHYILEVQQPCKNGKIIWVEFSIKFRFNAQNEIEIFGVSRNIDERKKMEKKVLYLSYHDQLTGLYNRRFYEEQLEMIDAQENLPISLVMADVNGLKLTNDAFGHLVGDKLLTTFADVLKKECRKDDIMARVGGDEFVLLLPHTEASEAEKLVKRIKTTISAKMVDQINLSVSFGWITKERADQSFDDVYKQAEDAMYRQKLFEGKSFKGETIKIIIKTLYEKYPLEKSHGERVSKLCRSIGKALKLSEHEVNELGMAGLLHDIGKIGLEEHVLDKPGKFTVEEWHLVKRHPEIGYQILKSVTEFADIAEAVLAHHEKPDGTGYPKGLKGNSIPYMSKIIAIADAFDAMTNHAVYKAEMSIEHAIQELKKHAGMQFDTSIAKVFVEKVLGHVWE